VQSLTRVAADRDGGESADADADRDAFQQRAPAVLVRRCLRAARGPQPRVDAGGYFFFDFLQEGCHHRVAVLGTQLVMGRGGRADLIG
jgi:hypothetical protein